MADAVRTLGLGLRLAVAYTASVALALPSLIASSFDVYGSNEGAVIVLAVLGAALGLFAVDIRAEARVAIVRSAVAICCFVGALPLAATLLRLGPVRTPEEGLVLLFSVGPGAAAVGSSLYSLRRWSWLLEALLCLLGVIAWAAALIRSVALMSWITAGPLYGALPDQVSSWEWLREGPAASGLVALAALPMVGLVALRLQARGLYRAAGGIVILGVGVALLSWSYRFPVLVAVLGLGAYFLVSKRAVRNRGLLFCCIAVLVLSIQPVDVTLRMKPDGPGLVRGFVGLPGPEAMKKARTNEIVFVGGCGDVYNAPRWLWVW